MIFENNKKASLVLADGTVFEGRSFGAEGRTFGEVVFTTGVIGYQETLTDPAFCGQIITQTFPLIGNYGIVEADDASEYHAAAGYIVREYCEEPSNFRCEGKLNDYLVKHNIIGIYDIDTRRLTRILREKGVMMGAIACGDFDKDAVMAEMNSFTPANALEAVGRKEKKAISAENGKYNVAVIDYGATNTLAEALTGRSCNVTLLPYNVSAADVLAEKPDGIILSQGAGNPADYTAQIDVIKELHKSGVPMYGINLGHQLLALANGCKTEKLNHGHRGASQPTKEVKSGKVFIASQNHGYVVSSDSVAAEIGEVSHVFCGDNTCQGIEYKNGNFGTQFMPELSGNPHDTGYLFDRFIKMMEDKK